jgi:hypothetical protein
MPDSKGEPGSIEADAFALDGFSPVRWFVVSQDSTEQLAERIEQAYRRRHPHWRLGCPNPRVWSAAALALLHAHQSDPKLPLDPELFVATQPLASPLSNPWEDLTQAMAAVRYRHQVHRIIRKLRRELRTEIQWAEDRLRQGATLETILRSRKRFLSPLGRYIIAFRAQRPDLMELFREPAQDQHWACPLYRHACRPLLPCQAYPVEEFLVELEFPARGPLMMSNFSLN